MGKLSATLYLTFADLKKKCFLVRRHKNLLQEVSSYTYALRDSLGPTLPKEDGQKHN